MPLLTKLRPNWLRKIVRDAIALASVPPAGLPGRSRPKHRCWRWRGGSRSSAASMHAPVETRATPAYGASGWKARTGYRGCFMG